MLEKLKNAEKVPEHASIARRQQAIFVGRGESYLGRSGELKKLMNAKKVNSRKSVRWSAVPVAPM